MNTEFSPLNMVKDEAYALSDALLDRKGITLRRGHSLDAISISCGFRNWNALSALCHRGIGFDAVMVADRHAEPLARYLLDRHGINISVSECAEILREITQEFSELLTQFRSESQPALPHDYSR